MTAKGAAAGSVWQSNRDDSAPAGLIAPTKAKASSVKTKMVASLPAFIEPQLTRLLEKPPAGPGWAHEIKFDGYRMQLRTVGGKATLLIRKGLDWSSKFPEIVKAGAGLGDGISTARSWRSTTAAPRTSPPCRPRFPTRTPRPGVLRVRSDVRRQGGLSPAGAGRRAGANWREVARVLLGERMFTGDANFEALRKQVSRLIDLADRGVGAAVGRFLGP